MSSFFFACVSGNRARFDTHEVHHLKVLRYQKHSQVKFTDGKGTLYLGQLISQDEAKILKKIDSQPPPSIDVKVIFSPVRWERTRFAIEKAVELGVSELYISNMDRTTRKKTPSKLLKANLTARDAMKQCGSFYLSTVKDMEEFDFSQPSTKIMLELEGKKKIDAVDFSKTIAIAIGPEGGFSKREKNFFENNGFEPVKLGKRVLRSETAMVAALTLVNYLTGNF